MGCTRLTALQLVTCNRITDAAVMAVASRCMQLTTLRLLCCSSITNTAVVAVALGCKQLTTLELTRCRKITDSSMRAIPRGVHVTEYSPRRIPLALIDDEVAEGLIPAL